MAFIRTVARAYGEVTDPRVTRQNYVVFTTFRLIFRKPKSCGVQCGENLFSAMTKPYLGPAVQYLGPSSAVGEVPIKSVPHSVGWPCAASAQFCWSLAEVRKGPFG